MSKPKTIYCAACQMEKAGAKSKIPFEHTCGKGKQEMSQITPKSTNKGAPESDPIISIQNTFLLSLEKIKQDFLDDIFKLKRETLLAKAKFKIGDLRTSNTDWYEKDAVWEVRDVLAEYYPNVVYVIVRRDDGLQESITEVALNLFKAYKK